MPSLFIPPHNLTFPDPILSNAQVGITVAAPYFIYAGKAYPQPNIVPLAVGAFALPISNLVNLLTVGANDRVFVTHFSAKGTVANPYQLRIGTSVIFHCGLAPTSFVIMIPECAPMNAGALGDDLNLFNTTATAQTVDLTVLGFVLTP